LISSTPIISKFRWRTRTIIFLNLLQCNIIKNSICLLTH
jgi:hypothetical protein